MPQPELNRTPPLWDQKTSPDAGGLVSAEAESDLTEVARTLVAHGGGPASFDLALDLVLNEVVEQARLSTGATGAAIALARGGEMECRATAGADAPELGARLETTSGLSGACLQTGKIQLCADTETDPLVNAEACRSLGVRSILILPLSDGKEPFGIFELFSPRPNAFGDRDINTLEVLARRVVENKKIAEDVAVAVPSVEKPSKAIADELTVIPEDERVWPPDVADVLEEPQKRSEVWTPILSILVILTAVLLGLALGFRAGIGQVMRGIGPQRARASSNANKTRVPASAAVQSIAPVGAVATVPIANSVPQPRPSNATNSAGPPDGGLQVTQNGKVIYRSPTADRDATTGKRAVTSSSEDRSATRLLHRVEPVYPPEARAQQIQGAVTLDVQIGGDGAVHNIEVVEGNPVLSEAAVQAVRQWRYRPYSVDGHPVEMQTRVTIRFTLPPP
jgi:TonB family protein